uniref:phytosulfokine receptor 1-like n=1 Tax=Erigeron canadensis TaxID=72917 RepID=UPI001CB97FD7|nr:phytosulfokine receptor 1-like [Erigeron canadensis]
MVFEFKFWAFVVFIWCFQVLVISQNLTCNSNDLKGLVGFMNGLDFPIDGWLSSNFSTNLSSLSSFNCCNLIGVKCDNISGRIVSLELPKKRLTGELSDLVSSLDQLKVLNLSHNFLNGPVPVSLFKLSQLEVLDLSSNDFNGVFPVSINLPALQVLDFSGNKIHGSIPAGICVNSTRIRVIKLAVNLIKGNIPFELTKCAFLEHICVASNFLSGSIPEFLFHLPRLGQLDVQDNLFTSITGIGNFSSRINRLDVSSNRLSGNLPDFFHKFPRLTHFSAQSNRFSGEIPSSLLSSPAISLINLKNNSINGSVKFNCSLMMNLTSLDLGTNNFSGSIPGDLSSCQKLKALNLARNNFVGEIPRSFRNFQSLSFLSLSNCSFTNLETTLTILQHCPNLRVLVLTMNFRGEQLPVDNTLHFKALKALVIANCGLTGTFPPWLKSSTQLQLLDLSWNQLTGTIPSYLGNFGSLFYLDLSNNSLSGEIPKDLTKLQSLSFRNMTSEEGSPDFPFFKRPNMSDRGSVLQYNQIMSFPPQLDLSHNFLNGSIWPEFGNLKKLHILDLKHNNLSGEIPSELSGMTSIETLDLSYNNLTGTIPSSLVKLSFLSKFSVAYNDLRGFIPIGGQFATFPNSSFDGNKELCEVTSCGDSILNPSSTRRTKKSKGAIAGMAVGIGFGTFFILAFLFVIILRATSKQVVDPEKEDGYESNKEEYEPRLVIFFQKKEELSLNDLLKSTNSFDQANIIGCGGFGLVFKATLPDGQKVAIKRLTGDTGQVDREFQAEVETLSRAQHPNLVLLQGYCQHKSDRFLIYSFMENGSLDYWLHEKPDGPSKLTWDTRLRIGQGAIKGLAYLHQSCDPHILHRDIKSSNILLDENFEAHLADFGLARIIPTYDTHVTTDLVGTLGYIPPEYGQASVASYKGDIYSFGVVLLELLTGKRPMDMCKPKGSRDLISWVMQMKKEKRENEVFDLLIFNKENAKEMLWVLEIACVCLNESPKLRPSTQELLSWLHHSRLNAC